MSRIKRVCRNDMMDEFLESQGFYRKHIARDASCLYRVVCDQVYCTQATHNQVRYATISYMRHNRHEFEQLISEDFDDHLEKLSDLKVLSGIPEMRAISRMLDVVFIVFEEVGKYPSRISATNDSSKEILACCSHDQHYDSVYPRSLLADAAFCQAIVYEVLYKKVFRMGNEANNAVEKMLHDKNYIRQRRSHPSCSLRLPDNDDMTGNPEDEVRDAIEQGIPPFPFKVAKALDPNIYRNVEYDAWNDARKEQIRANLNGTADFQPGDKCLVIFDREKDDVHIGYIQEMNPNKGPVTVFVEEFGRKCVVPYESLEILQMSREAGWTRRLCSRALLNNGIVSPDYAKSKLFRGRRFREVTLPVAFNAGNTTFHAQPPLTIRPLSQRPSNIPAPRFASRSYQGGQVVYLDNKDEEQFNEDAENAESKMEDSVDVAPESMVAYPAQYNVSPYSDGRQSVSPDYANETDSSESSSYRMSGSNLNVVNAPLNYNGPMLTTNVPYVMQSPMVDPNASLYGPCRPADIGSGDLPLSDVNTLRYFYNLGCEYYRMTVQSPPIPFCGCNHPIAMSPPSNATMMPAAGSPTVNHPDSIAQVPQNLSLQPLSGPYAGMQCTSTNPPSNYVFHGSVPPVYVCPTLTNANTNMSQVMPFVPSTQ